MGLVWGGDAVYGDRLTSEGRVPANESVMEVRGSSWREGDRKTNKEKLERSDGKQNIPPTHHI